jgi:hypothetical protein
MKSLASRILATAVLSALAWLVLIGAAAAPKSSGPILQPDKLIILSTTDVKGKTGPCG